MKKMSVYFTTELSLVKALEKAYEKGKGLLAGEDGGVITPIMDAESGEVLALISVYDGEHNLGDDLLRDEVEV